MSDVNDAKLLQECNASFPTETVLKLKDRPDLAYSLGYINCGKKQSEKVRDYEAALEELVDILTDPEARIEIDSFTSQPAENALAKWKR